jgi:tripartite-type tricarboxylate transporter receptor subunit TctC
MRPQTFIRISRRAALAAALLAVTLPALAQTAGGFPSKTVKFINTFPPGGPSDILGRSIADTLQAVFKQPFVMENRPGASGNVGADAVAKSAPDGYTVMIGIDTTFTVNPHIYKSMPFKPADMKPLMVMASSGLLIGVHPGTGFKTMNDLIAAGKNKGITLSSAGSGSPGHLAAQVLTEATGVKVNHITYKGNSPAVLAVLSGEVNGGALATPGMLPHVKAGKITALAVTSRQRSPLAPDVPTVGELGLKNLEQEVLYVAMVPAATPEPVVQLLQRAFTDAMARPDLRERLASLDMHYEGLVGDAASKRMAELSDRYARVIKATGMKVE